MYYNLNNKDDVKLVLNYCPKCGSNLEGNEEKCLNCGYDLSDRSQIAETSTEFRNTDIEYADFVQRAIAWFIDMIVVIIISSPLSLFLNFGSLLLLTNVYNFALGFLYFWLLEAFNNGQTLGKMILRIRSVNADNFETTDAGMYALNNLTKASGFLILDVILGILLYFSEQGSNRNTLRISQHFAHIVVTKA
ncbi:MAG: hypothetical protein EU517_01395 [Promethearchaeota archaeon]|nr:MAG: hypothetical protein EU517_01395 [Candidatus Lokiarchaeota archaeon]